MAEDQNIGNSGEEEHWTNCGVNAMQVWEGTGCCGTTQRLLLEVSKTNRNGDGEIREETKGTFQRTLEVTFFLPTRKEE